MHRPLIYWCTRDGCVLRDVQLYMCSFRMVNVTWKKWEEGNLNSFPCRTTRRSREVNKLNHKQTKIYSFLHNISHFFLTVLFVELWKINKYLVKSIKKGWKNFFYCQIFQFLKIFENFENLNPLNEFEWIKFYKKLKINCIG